VKFQIKKNNSEELRLDSAYKSDRKTLILGLQK